MEARLTKLIQLFGRRLMRMRVIEFGLWWLVVGQTLAILLAVAALFVPIAHYRLIAIGIAVVAVFAGALYAQLRRRVSLNEAALAMDAAHPASESAVVTALDYIADGSALASYQRRMALDYAERLFKKLPPLRPFQRFRRAISINGVGLLLLVLALIVPNPMDSELAQRKAEADWVKAQQDLVAEQLEKLEPALLGEKAKQSMQDTLEELSDELARQHQALPALDELEKAMKRLDKHAEAWKKELDASAQLAEHMQKEPALHKLGQSLQQNDVTNRQKAIEHLKKEVAKMTPEQKEQLAEALEQMAQTASAVDADTQQKLRKQLAETAQAVKSSENNKQSAEELAAALQELEEQLAKLAEQMQQQEAELAAATQQAAQLAQAGIPMAAQLAAEGANVPAVWLQGGYAHAVAQASAPAGTSGAPNGSQPGSPGSPLAGSGAGAGTGAGEGSGAGAGTANGGAGGAGSGGTSNGIGGLTGGNGSGTRDLVTTPRSMQGSGNVQLDGGAVEGSGGEMQKGGVAPVLDGTARPYDEVYADYASEARQALNRQPLPQNMQSLVRDYFIEIQPQ